MSKKRTRKQKIRSQVKLVNSQFVFASRPQIKKVALKEKAVTMAKYDQLASIRRELIRSLIIAVLILASLMVLYWFS